MNDLLQLIFNHLIFEGGSMHANELKQLSPLELLLVHKHIKLGKKHLHEWLSDEEMEQLLLLVKKDKEAEKGMDADTPEFVGRISLALNTIFTATFGAWMGVSGFMDLSLNKPFLFFSLLGFATLMGGLIGFHNYQYTRKEAKNAIEEKQIKMITTNILKTLNQYREEELENKFSNLNEILKKLQISGIELLNLPPHEFNDHKVCLNWLYQTDRAIKDLEKNEQMAHLFSAEIKAVQTSLEGDIDRDNRRKKAFSSSVIHKLTGYSIQPPARTPSWVRTNFRSIFISMIPVMLGGFSSFFVYIGGAPRIAQEMSQTELYTFLVQPKVKYIELVTALGMTLFFAYSSVYLNWKAFKRDQELKKIDAIVMKEEMQLELIDDKFLKVKQVEDVMKPISRLYTAFKKMISKNLKID